MIYNGASGEGRGEEVCLVGSFQHVKGLLSYFLKDFENMELTGKHFVPCSNWLYHIFSIVSKFLQLSKL